MRNVVSFLLFSSVAFAQVPNPNPFPASFAATLKPELCQKYLGEFEKAAPDHISIAGKVASKGCLQSNTQADGVVMQSLWKNGYDLGIDLYGTGGRYYQVWQKTGGTDGYALQYYWDAATRSMQIYYLRLQDMTTTMKGSLFRPDNHISEGFLPLTAQGTYSSWTMDPCFDPQAVTKLVVKNPDLKPQVTGWGCQAFNTSRDRLLSVLTKLINYDVISEGGVADYSWLGQYKTDASELLYLNIQSLPSNPSVMVVAWTKLKVNKK